VAKRSTTIQYTEEAEADIVSLRKFDQRKILSAIFRHLGKNPTKESKSRIKRMRQPFWCQFRLRVEDYRVYYDVEADGLVTILRVLEKGREETSGGDSHETD
jgi:mRNA-degrading endonuclease RelE of RelBE toxin-antitoxin system